MATLAIVGSTGPDDPTKASLPFHIAVNGAVPNGTDSVVILAGDATGLLGPGVADTVRGVGIAPLANLLAKCGELGVPIHV